MRVDPEQRPRLLLHTRIPGSDVFSGSCLVVRIAEVLGRHVGGSGTRALQYNATSNPTQR